MSKDHRKITAVLEVDTANFFAQNSFLSIPPQFRSSASLILGLQNHFSSQDLAFITYETLLSHGFAYEIERDHLTPKQLDLSTDLLLIFSVNNNHPYFGVPFVRRQLEAYRSLSDRVSEFVNPVDTKFLLDKQALYATEEAARYLPRQHSSSNWDQLASQLHNGTTRVLKPRMGADSNGIHLLRRTNLANARSSIGEDLTDYIAQEQLDIKAEIRYLICGDDFLAAKIAYDRNLPWDDQHRLKESYLKERYEPSREEIERALRIHHALNLFYSAVDFARTPQGDYLLEVNGICPGLVDAAPPSPLYNLGNAFAERLYQKLEQRTSLIPV